MATFVSLLIILLALLAVQYRRPSAPGGTVGSAAVLLLGTLLLPLGGLLVLLLWLGFVAVAAVANLDDWRRRHLTGRVLTWYRTVLPAMSDTEREAMEAGSVWWDGELFSGRPEWSRLASLPGDRLTQTEQAFLDGPVEELCAMLDRWQINAVDRDLSPAVWTFIREQGFFGLVIPQQYGGKGFSASAHSQVVLKVASRSIAAGVTVMVPNSLGPAELLVHYGTEAQRAHYLPRLARGEEVPCFALTGPEAGSDAGAMPDRGIVCHGEHDGAQVLGIRVTFDKRYITLAPVATVMGLAFILDDPDGLLGDPGELGITVALVPTDTPGVAIGRRHNPLHIPFQNGPIRGRDVFIPLDWVIGGRDGIGRGWRMLVESLSVGRGISLPALSVASGKFVSRYVGAYARVREQFGLPVGRFEGVQEALARIVGNTLQMEGARQLTLRGLDQGEKPAVLTAILKYHATERMRQVVNDGMDIQGGAGIMAGPRNLLSAIYQALPIGITVEGANILTRSLIIFGQGAARAHPWVLKEMEAAADPDPEAGLVRFDTALKGHLGYLASNLAATVLLGLTAGRFVGGTGPFAAEQRQLTRLAAAFALVADAAMLTLGGDLKRREALSARLGDVLSQLYLASGVLYLAAQPGRQPLDEASRWALQDLLFKMQEALLGVLRNLPNRSLALLLRIAVFPLGAHLGPPTDRLGQTVAGLVQRDGPARDLLTAGIYLPEENEDPAWRLDRALALADTSQGLRRRMRSAGWEEVAEASMSGEGESLLAQYEALVREIIQVDDFPADLAAAESAVNEGGSRSAG
ncbi:MAG: acyl-CoA dehydrogenase [Pseudomonadota bacterium]|nr:acyl-CoA dehydrogenase [Pseudomonadota bacterium]